MPWFPVPFIITKGEKTQTRKYTYTEVNWSEDEIPPSVIDITTANSSTFWYYDGDFTDYDEDYPENTSPIQMSIPKITVNNISGGVINLSTIPVNHTKKFSMQYILKFKANPKSTNKIINFCFCRNGVGITDIMDYFGGIFDEITPTDQWTCWYTPSPICYCQASIRNGKKATITTTKSRSGFHTLNMNYNYTGEETPYSDHYSSCVDETVYQNISVDLSKEDSYAYLVLDIVTFTPSSSSTHGTSAYNDGRRADASLFHAMELNSMKDIIFGEGFSVIYIGEENVSSGMINMGENAPSAIYVGENLVWNN